MIIYSKSRDEFTRDVLSNQIEVQLLDAFKRRAGHRVGESEVRSWKNSLLYMNNVFVDQSLAGDAQVSVEYKIPQTSKRIDVIVSGQNESRQDVAVIVELKQWEKVQATDRDAIVETFMGRSVRETPHPSYQAWSYAVLLEDYNETVRDENISLVPCAYLHNCVTPEALRDAFYDEYTAKAPVFLKADAKQLGEFIKKHVRYGDKNQIMYRIENGRISPSKNLADKLASLLEGNREFLMIDDQKLVFERTLSLAEKATGGRKQVFIVEGGPGTGKSVVAVNLLVELIQQGKTVHYVTKNAAPRDVYAAKLVGTLTKTRFSNLFKGSGSYIDVGPDELDVLVIDEAHRLNAKTGLYQKGENQVKELINAAKMSVFFIDEAQRVTFKDIGTKAEIKRWAKELGAELHEGKLESQFRCNGSDGYLAWVTNALEIAGTANTILNENGPEYDFRVCDSPNELFRLINARNNLGKHARMVAGYCWPWISKKDKSLYDICFDEHDFSMQWNLTSDGNTWILRESSIHQIGCIHTCQGLELDYVGVIIGPDLVVRDGTVQTDGRNRASTDHSLWGFKRLLKSDPDAARQWADSMIKNTYMTLLTRGQKGCYIWCTDPETNEYFKSLLVAYEAEETQEEESVQPLPFEEVGRADLTPFVNAVPVYDIKAGVGELSSEQYEAECRWVSLPEPFKPQPDYFLLQVIGDSMNRQIPSGAWCLFKKAEAGTPQGKIVLAEYSEHSDADHGGKYTVKRYYSTKDASPDGDMRISLKPDSHASTYRDIQVPPAHADSFRIIGEFVAMLDA